MLNERYRCDLETGARLPSVLCVGRFIRRSRATADWDGWQQLRGALNERQQRRTQRGRSRRDADRYLSRLERRLIQPGLPAWFL